MRAFRCPECGQAVAFEAQSCPTCAMAVGYHYPSRQMLALSGRTDVFHVFIYAPFEERVRRLESTGRSERDAIDLAETIDRDRAEFIKQYFKVEWPGRDRFHLMLNSAMGDAIAVTIILDAIAQYNAVENHRSTQGAEHATGP